MKKKKSFIKNKILWDKAIRFVKSVVKARKQFPEDEMFGLAPLAMRSATSVAAYIAESYDTKGSKRQRRLLTIAQINLNECLDHLIEIDNQGYGKTGRLIIEAEQVSILLESYIKALRR